MNYLFFCSSCSQTHNHTTRSGFLHHIQLASHELATFGINVTKIKILNLNLMLRKCAEGYFFDDMELIMSVCGVVIDRMNSDCQGARQGVG